MIPRYTRQEMSQVWSEENRFKQMLEVEILAAEAMSKMGAVPKSAVAKIRKKAKINIERINEIELTVKHDVIAFLTQVVESVGPEARFLHLGMTSSDVLDTALSVQMKQSCELLSAGMSRTPYPDKSSREKIRVHAHDGPHARCARGTHNVRAQGCLVVFRNKKGERDAGKSRRDRKLRKDLRRGGHVRSLKPQG